MSTSHFDNVMRDTDPISVTGKAMVAAIIVLFFAVIFVIFLHLYAKWFWGPNPNSGSRSRRLVFSSERDEAPVPRRGLDPSIIRSLPVLIFQPAEFKDGLECAVCLCELSDGEKARLLPKCNHGFHLDCIDMWFQSHSTCPLCRNLVAPQSSQLSESEIQVPNGNSIEGQPPESLNFPTNVLFWGTQDMVNTGRTNVEEGPSSSSNKEQDGNGKIVIEIPRRLTQGFSASSSLNSARSTEEEVKSPSTQLRSLKRFLGREKRVVVPSNPNGGDVEQGLGGNGQSFRVALDS